MKIRPATPADADAVLALNEESVQSLSPLDLDGFDRHSRDAAHILVCEIDGEVAGFAIAYGPGTTYGSINYAWHAQRFDDFLYLDRIAVGSSFRRRGIASLLYDEMESRAATHGRMVCEVNSDPPNVESLSFHHARGYRDLGHLQQPGGKQTVMMEKPL